MGGGNGPPPALTGPYAGRKERDVDPNTNGVDVTGHGASAAPVELFSKAKARERRERLAHGYLFPLTATGGAARVTKLNMTDNVVLRGIPTHLQGVVLRTFRNGGSAPPKDWDGFLKDAEDSRQIANALCIMGFLEPRLVATEAEAEADPDAVWVEDIDIDDRIRFMRLSARLETEAAVGLVPFPAARVGGVEAVSAGQPNRPAVLRPVGVDPSGV